MRGCAAGRIEPPAAPAQEVTVSFTGSGRMTTVSATGRISSAGIPTRCACLRIASGEVAWWMQTVPPRDA
jgi:hypothetical protein